MTTKGRNKNKERISHRNSLRLELSVHVVESVGADLSGHAEHRNIQRCFHVLGYRLLHAVHRLNDRRGRRRTGDRGRRGGGDAFSPTMGVPYRQSNNFTSCYSFIRTNGGLQLRKRQCFLTTFVQYPNTLYAAASTAAAAATLAEGKLTHHPKAFQPLPR